MFLHLHDIQEAWKRATGGTMFPILTKQRRGMPMGEHILNRMTHGMTVMVCDACEDERTLKNRGYVELRRFHGEAICDGCQEFGPIAMWLYEDSTWHSDLRQEPRLNEVRRRDRAVAERYRR